LEGKFGPKDVVPVDVDKKGEFSFTRQVHWALKSFFCRNFPAPVNSVHDCCA
jgi:hypothetical protein